MTFQPKPYTVYCTVTTKECPNPSTHRVGTCNTVPQAAAMILEDKQAFMYAAPGGCLLPRQKGMTREYHVFKAAWTDVTGEVA